MSENIDNDAVVEDVTVEEAAVVEEKPEVAEEVAVVEEAPVAEAPKAKEDKKPATKTKVEDFVNNKDAVAVYSSRAINYRKLGKVLPEGFSVVPVEEARHWLAFTPVRPATPAEVAKEFGK